MSILQEIFDHKRTELAQRELLLSLRDLKSMARDASPTRGFRRSLDVSGHSLALIAEVKKASPSEGTIREDFDAAEIAKAYAKAGADCLSVLTDEKYFSGSTTNLRLCREAVDLPILRKDFTSADYHVFEARAMGADAILLIVAGLSPTQLSEFSGLAKELGMDVLVEVHTEDEMAIARDLNADLVGINNRNLSTFKTDLQTTIRLAPLAPPHALLVGESGLCSRKDTEFIERAGARAALIGTAFCSSLDPYQAVLETMGWS